MSEIQEAAPLQVGGVPSRPINFALFNSFSRSPSFLELAYWFLQNEIEYESYKKASPGAMIHSKHQARNKQVAVLPSMEEDICIYIAWFLVELSLEFFVIWAWIANTFYMLTWWRKQPVCHFLRLFISTVLLLMLFHMIFAEFWNPKGEGDHFDITFLRGQTDE